MNAYFSEFIAGIDKRANENGGIVEMNEWFHNLSFDVPCSHTSSDCRSLGLSLSAKTLVLFEITKNTSLSWRFMRVSNSWIWFLTLVNKILMIAVLPRSMVSADFEINTYPKERSRDASSLFKGWHLMYPLILVHTERSNQMSRTRNIESRENDSWHSTKSQGSRDWRQIVVWGAGVQLWYLTVTSSPSAGCFWSLFWLVESQGQIQRPFPSRSLYTLS